MSIGWFQVVNCLYANKESKMAIPVFGMAIFLSIISFFQFDLFSKLRLVFCLILQTR